MVWVFGILSHCCNRSFTRLTIAEIQYMLHPVLEFALRYDASFYTLLPLVGHKHISVLPSLIWFVEGQNSDPCRTTGVGLFLCHTYRACRWEMYIKLLTESPNAKETTSDVGVYDKITLKWAYTFREQNVNVRPCFSWFRAGSNDGFLFTRFNKISGST